MFVQVSVSYMTDLIWFLPKIAAFAPPAAPANDETALSLRTLSEGATALEPSALKFVTALLVIFLIWAAVNAVWSAPDDSLLGSVRQLGNRGADHLFLAFDLRAASEESPEHARLLSMRRGRAVLLSAKYRPSGTVMTLTPAYTDQEALSRPLHGRVARCRRMRDDRSAYEVEIAFLHPSLEERAEIDLMLETLHPLARQS